MFTPNSCCKTVMITVPDKGKTLIETLLLLEKTPLTRSKPRVAEDTTRPKEYGLVQGRRVMFMFIATLRVEKAAINAHCKLRQSSEMVQSPEVARDRVWFLTLLSESHICDRVTLGGQVGGSSGGDGEGDGDGEDEGKGEDECDGEDEGGGDSEGESDGDGEGDGRAVEVSSVVVMSAQMSAQCM